MFDTLRGYLLIMNPNGPALCLGYPFCSAQSSINRAAAPLLSPLIREFVRLMDVPCVANQLKLPTGPHSLSTNFSSVMLVSMLYLYWLRSEAGLFKYALGLRFTPAFSISPEIYKSGLIEKVLSVDICSQVRIYSLTENIFSTFNVMEFIQKHPILSILATNLSL
jgi:hypothetical protein